MTIDTDIVPEDLVFRVADAALEPLLDRGGIKHVLGAIKYDDPDIWDEIREDVGLAALRAVLT